MQNSFDLLLNELNKLTSNADYESALSLMKKWLDALATDYRLHGKVFASPDFLSRSPCNQRRLRSTT